MNFFPVNLCKISPLRQFWRGEKSWIKSSVKRKEENEKYNRTECKSGEYRYLRKKKLKRSVQQTPWEKNEIIHLASAGDFVSKIFKT